MIKSLIDWDTAYINSLPDEAFAVIEPAYKSGDTEDKNCRHLPHHTEEVKDGSDSKDHVDMDHLRNAWQRRNQIKPVTDSISQEDLIARAERHLKKHINDLELDWGEESKDIELIRASFRCPETATAVSLSLRPSHPVGNSPKTTMPARAPNRQSQIPTNSIAPASVPYPRFTSRIIYATFARKAFWKNPRPCSRIRQYIPITGSPFTTGSGLLKILSGMGDPIRRALTPISKSISRTILKSSGVFQSNLQPSIPPR